MRQLVLSRADALWRADVDDRKSPAFEEQFLVLVKRRDEQQQVELLERFAREGMGCKALLA